MSATLEKPSYQLFLPLDGIEEAVRELEHLSTEEVHRRSEHALAALSALRVKGEGEGEEPPRWMELYLRLKEGGWPWRVAVYIAWAAQPKRYRWPATQEELATACLGLTSDRAIATWRKKNPAIDEVISMLQAAIIYDALPDAFDAMVSVATAPDYKGHQDRKLMFEMAGVYTPSAKLLAELRKRGLATGDLADLSDDELRDIAALAGGELTRRSEDEE